jgi:hypothetical protein
MVAYMPTVTRVGYPKNNDLYGSSGTLPSGKYVQKFSTTELRVRHTSTPSVLAQSITGSTLIASGYQTFRTPSGRLFGTGCSASGSLLQIWELVESAGVVSFNVIGTVPASGNFSILGSQTRVGELSVSNDETQIGIGWFISPNYYFGLFDATTAAPIGNRVTQGMSQKFTAVGGGRYFSLPNTPNNTFQLAHTVTGVLHQLSSVPYWPNWYRNYYPLYICSATGDGDRYFGHGQNDGNPDWWTPDLFVFDFAGDTISVEWNTEIETPWPYDYIGSGSMQAVMSDPTYGRWAVFTPRRNYTQVDNLDEVFLIDIDNHTVWSSGPLVFYSDDTPNSTSQGPDNLSLNWVTPTRFMWSDGNNSNVSVFDVVWTPAPPTPPVTAGAVPALRQRQRFVR